MNLIVDYAVYGPSREPNKDRIIMDGEKERQGDFVFTATEVGEYRFCFDNSMSSFSDKLVDFEITVCINVLMLSTFNADWCHLGRERRSPGQPTPKSWR